MTGIYYLWNGASVLYIGQSRNIEKRVAQHKGAWGLGFEFIGYFADECPPHELDQRERDAIREFKPLLNVKDQLES